MSERVAFISDLHSNLEALTAVLNDIATKRVKKIFCLGDVVGYGPNPAEVLDVARKACEVVIEGNHDEAVSGKIPRVFKRIAAKAALWTRQQVRPKKGQKYLEHRERWKYLKGLDETFTFNDWLLAHGSPVSNLDYVYDQVNALEVFERDMADVRICFLGHTHVPGIFLLDGEHDVHYVPAEEGKRYRVKSRKVIVNVGSVGQPRDGDPRACWVLAREDGSVTFRRVEYEIDPVADKIVDAGLDQSLARRLYVGE